MALSVIGAGFGRTGTESMKLALEMLGLGPCHHMKEVLADPTRLARWRSIAQGAEGAQGSEGAEGTESAEPDWDEVFAGYRSTVDWPGAYFWRALARHYPDAKILLTVRSAESWYASMENTILATLRASTDPASIGRKLIGEQVFGGRLDDRYRIIAAFEKNTADVEAAFPPEQLLTYQLGDGWAPLCRFLGKPTPATPYPRSNSTAEFAAMVAQRNATAR